MHTSKYAHVHATHTTTNHLRGASDATTIVVSSHVNVIITVVNTITTCTTMIHLRDARLVSATVTRLYVDGIFTITIANAIANQRL